MPPDVEILNLHRIWSETDRRLDSLAAQVREGVGVDEASNFSRWLRFSGLLKLLSPFEQDGPLPVRAAELQQKNEALIGACGEWYSLHQNANAPRDCYVSASRIESIEKQLLQLNAQFSALAGVGGSLRVIDGGKANEA